MSALENTQVTPIRLGIVNVFLIRSPGGFFLIDSGMGFNWKTLKAELDKAGCAPGKLKLVILTHGDLDHTGNAQRLRSLYRAKVAIHPKDRLMIEQGIAFERVGKSLFDEFLINLIHLLSHKVAPRRAITPDVLLKDGQDLSRYGLGAKVIHVPGHTPGSIAILTKDGCLFSGDTLINNLRPETAVFIQNEDELNSSLAKLSRAKVRIVYPGHGRPFSGEEMHKLIGR